MSAKKSEHTNNGAAGSETVPRGTVAHLLRKNGKAVFISLLLLCTFAAGFFLRPFFSHPQNAPLPDGGTLGHQGPWGELEYIPITIAPPEELLPIRHLEANPVHWFFGGWASNSLAGFLSSAGLPERQIQLLMNPPMLRVLPNGLEISPPRDVIFSLSPRARQEIYHLLSGFPENKSEFIFLPAKSMDKRYKDNGVSSTTKALFEKLSCTYGNYLAHYGLSTILAEIPDYQEKIRFVRAITSQPTFLVKLKVSPDSDIHALNKYWGKACWSTDVSALLESLTAIRGGAWIDIIELMPPLPTALLYTYPIPRHSTTNPMPRHDCHWTSFNFFRDVPDDQFGNDLYISQKLQSDYYPITADPRFGDIALFVVPGANDAIHSAVFLADDIVYTKNGALDLYPWMFSSISNLLEQYSFYAQPGQQLEVRYFRNKYY